MAPFDLLPRLLPGLWLTVQLTLGGALVAAVCAFAAGLARASRWRLLRWPAALYVEVFRGTSALVQLFWFYFVLPHFGLVLPAEAVGIGVLGLNIGAYGAEVVRGALGAVSQGQREAAAALALSPWQCLRHIVLPQALPRMLPPFGNLLVELLKGTALVSTIALSDLLRAGLDVRDDEPRRMAEAFALVLLLYFLLSSMLGLASRGLERRLGRWRALGR